METDWRQNKQIQEKLGYIFTNSLLTDFIIKLINDEKTTEFKVHSVILTLQSMVFEKTFKYKTEEGSSKIIEIKDMFGPEAFHCFLKHLYCMPFKFKNVYQAWEIYGMADYYSVDDLKTICFHYLGDSVNELNACYCLEMAEFYCVDDIKEISLEVIRKNTRLVITHESFQKAKESTVETILDQKELSTNEIDLFTAIESWIKSKDKKTQQKLIESLIPKIRFCSMTLQQFIDGPCSSGLLSKDEISVIKGHLSKARMNKPLPLHFIKPKRSLAFGEELKSNFSTEVENTWMTMAEFVVDREVSLNGLTIFTKEGNKEDRYTEDVYVTLWNPVSGWNTAEYNKETNYSSWIFLKFSPLLNKLIPGNTYVIRLAFAPGLRKLTKYKNNLSISNGEITFTFHQYMDEPRLLPLSSLFIEYEK